MVAWNGRPFLETAIPSVLDALGDHGDLLVVENGSTDGSFEFLRNRFPDVAVLRTGANLGGAGGFSAGMRVALEDGDCEYVWLLDNDILVETGALDPLLETLSVNPDAAAAGSQLCLYDHPDTVQELGSRYTSWLGALQQLYAGEQRLPPASPACEVDYLAACSLLIRSSVLKQQGLFREELFIFYDDVEWSLRIRRAGHRLLAVPGSVVRHCYGGEKPTVPWREYYRKRNRCVCLRLEPPRGSRLLALYIYLGYLGALARYLYWQGDRVLASAYRRALHDFNSGRLGKREFRLPSPDRSVLPEKAGRTTVFLDTSLAPGDAIAAWQSLQQACPSIEKTERKDPPDIAVVGERYSWFSTQGRLLLRYRCGERWTRILHPRREWALSRLRLLGAILVAFPAAVPIWLRALRRSRPPAPLP